jgi:uncharacterized membrane protein
MFYKHRGIEKLAELKTIEQEYALLKVSAVMSLLPTVLLIAWRLKNISVSISPRPGFCARFY